MPDDEERPLLPKIGPLPAARAALALVAHAAHVGPEPQNLEQYDEVGENLLDLLATLTNLSVLLATMVAGLGHSRDTASKRALLDRILLDQEMIGARAALDDLDVDGSPW